MNILLIWKFSISYIQKNIYLVVVTLVVVVEEMVVSEVVFVVVFAVVEVEAVVVFVLTLSFTKLVSNFGEIRIGVTAFVEVGHSLFSAVKNSTFSPSSGL